MRINVYNEEITGEFEFVEKHVEATGKTYYGFRFYFESSPKLHHTEDDDDRSAITFWCGTMEESVQLLSSAHAYARSCVTRHSDAKRQYE